MPRTPWLLFVVLPSLLIAALAWRSIEQQQVVVENQAAALYEAEAVALADETRAALDAAQRAFDEVVGSLAPLAPETTISRALSDRIPGAVGFVLTPESTLLSPTPEEAAKRQEVHRFFVESADFLQTETPAVNETTAAATPAPAAKMAAPGAGSKLDYANVQQRSATLEKQAAPAAAPPPPTNPNPAAFRKATAGAASGRLARFNDEGTEIIIWRTLADAVVVGCVMDPSALTAWFKARLPQDTARTGDYLLALRDERGRMVWTSRPGESPAGEPFIVRPINDPLPHWDALLWLADPTWLERNATIAKLTIALLTAVALGVILVGAFLILHTARKQLDLARRKSDIVSSVSHELKTPITSIRMFAELLQQPNLPAAKRSQFTDVIAAECERLSRLVNNILALARIDHAKTSPPDARCDLVEVARRTTARLAPTMADANCPVRLDAPATAPAALSSDEAEQILVNLLGNAEKYAANSGEVVVSLRCDPTHAILTVSDNGPGVPPGAERRIFQEFERGVDPMTSGKPGAGLGLAICARLLASRGGSITCTNRPTGGATFTCSIPCPSAS